MSKGKNASFSRVEWEGFTNKLEIDKIEEAEFIPKGAETIEIWRDDNYKLKGRILGSYEGPMDEPRGNNKHIAGTIVPSIEIEGSADYGMISYKLSHCYIGSISNKATHLDSRACF